MAWHLDGNWDGVAYDANAPYLLADLFTAINERYALIFHTQGMSHASALNVHKTLALDNSPLDQLIIDMLGRRMSIADMINDGLDLPATYSLMSNEKLAEVFAMFSYLLSLTATTGYGFVYPSDRSIHYASLEHLCSVNSLVYHAAFPHCPFPRCGMDEAANDQNPFNWYKSIINAMTIMDVESDAVFDTGVSAAGSMVSPYNFRTREYNLTYPFETYDPVDGAPVEVPITLDDAGAYALSRGGALAESVSYPPHDGHTIAFVGNSYVYTFQNYALLGPDALVYSTARYFETADDVTFLLVPNTYLAGSTLIDVVSEPISVMVRLFTNADNNPSDPYHYDGPFRSGYSGDATIVSVLLDIDVYVNDTFVQTIHCSDGVIDVSVPISDINFSVWPFETADRIVFVPRWADDLPLEVSQDTVAIPYGTGSATQGGHFARISVGWWPSPWLTGYIDISGAMTVA